RRGRGHYPGFFCAATAAQKIQCPPQGKRTTSFFSAWSSEIFRRRRAASRDGDQTWERTAAHPAGGIERWRANRHGTFGPDDRRNDLRTPLGIDGSGVRARSIKGRAPRDWQRGAV